MIFEEIQEDIFLWESFIHKFLGLFAQLVSISQYDGNRRVYRCNTRIFKVRRIVRENFRRANELEGEFRILSKLKGVKGICQNPEYFREEGWEILSYDAAPGESLANLLLNGNYPCKVIVLLSILKVIVQVNLRGIAHRDIKSENIIVDRDQNVKLIDFDQAVESPVVTALLVDVFGIGSSTNIGFFCFEGLAERYLTRFPLLLRPISVAFRMLRRLTKTGQPQQEPLTPEYCTDNPDVQLIQQAWEIARHANANSPGQGVAYYSLDFAGLHFHGERPWALRWSEINKKIDFKGKRVIECGCNLGLFTAFARRAGARECVGVDLNSEILAGSRLVSKALHVQNDFVQVDFDSKEPWEEQFVDFDIAIALSVIHWLKNRDRFLVFLGKHREVLFEGHETIEIETERLRRAGFENIELITISERNRAILYAYK